MRIKTVRGVVFKIKLREPTRPLPPITRGRRKKITLRGTWGDVVDVGIVGRRVRIGESEYVVESFAPETGVARLKRVD